MQTQRRLNINGMATAKYSPGTLGFFDPYEESCVSLLPRFIVTRFSQDLQLLNGLYLKDHYRTLIIQC